MDWYKKTVEEVSRELSTDTHRGLSSDEVKRRLERYGYNRLVEVKKESRLKRFLRQFTELIILVLIGAAIIAGILGEWIDSLAILAIVILNGVIGFIQEEKAEKVLEELKKLTAPTAKVLRDGNIEVIPASELVPGDVVILDSGDNVPADCRIIEAQFLRIDESPLTGESHPVDKDPGALENTLPLGDRTNMAYLGTTVVYGKGRAIVVATGMSTEMGKIAKMLEEVEREPTPLQKRLSEFGRFLVYAAGGICAVIFVLGIVRGEDILVMFLTAVSLAVAAIPEGLPAVVTIVLALGVQRMVKRHALIRRLPSVETLGSATVIASDKTGTLTQNQMTVKKVFLATGEMIDVTGAGYEPTGEFFIESKRIEPASDPTLTLALRCCVLCNGAELKQDRDGNWYIIGDPTEGALLTLARKAGVDREGLLKEFTLTGEIPFDAERKMMTTVYKDREGMYFAFVKGAPERVLDLCTMIQDGERSVPVTEDHKKKILSVNDGFARSALRVLALAYRVSSTPLDHHVIHELERDLVFIGLAGMIDPPREEVFIAIQKAKNAGILPVMITGDNKLTAEAIAREIGAFGEGDISITGTELDTMEDEELAEKVPRIKVYARVNPEHKLRIVRAWKRRGEIIAMTGDGVNDAPALKEADIGIAMGITGTDVTKEASDMVLTDDNFASIVSAVEEGRGIFDNIRKVVHFLLSCNIGEIFTLFIASLSGMPLPLVPVQILWMNLVTDGLPAIGLAMESVDPGVMDRKPRPKDEGIVTASLFRIMLLQGLFMAVITLGVYGVELYLLNSGIEKARTMAFMVLVFSQMFHVFNCRSERESVFTIGPFSNRLLNLSVLLILLTQPLLSYIPALQVIFKVIPLGIVDWIFVFMASVQTLVLMEIVKSFMKDKKR